MLSGKKFQILVDAIKSSAEDGFKILTAYYGLVDPNSYRNKIANFITSFAGQETTNRIRRIPYKIQ